MHSLQPTEETVHLAKGTELGHFGFGGVAVCVLFKQGRVKWRPCLLRRSEEGAETVLRMGQRAATAVDRTPGVWLRADAPV